MSLYQSLLRTLRIAAQFFKTDSGVGEFEDRYAVWKRRLQRSLRDGNSADLKQFRKQREDVRDQFLKDHDHLSLISNIESETLE